MKTFYVFRSHQASRSVLIPIKLNRSTTGLTISPQINCRLLSFAPALIFKVLQCRSKLAKLLSECQTAWIRIRRRVTRCLIQIQVVCILDNSCACWSRDNILDMLTLFSQNIHVCFNSWQQKHFYLFVLVKFHFSQ